MWSGKKSLILILVLLLIVVSFTSADIKDYVFIVRPELDQDTQEMFENIATWYERNNNPSAANYYRYFTGEVSGGTGWIYVDESGANYIITNQHVVGGGSTANIYFENADGTRQIYEDCQILYVDDAVDLAVLQFPEGKRLFETGFNLDTTRQRDLDRVISAGFPGFGSGGEQIWQLASGEITNAQMKSQDYADYDYLIQHSAPIDHGNSGGPLLKEDPNSAIGYTVVGVNTFKGHAGNQLRENTFLAIPAKEIETVIAKAKEVSEIADNERLLEEELVRNCKILASELRSEHRSDTRGLQYIAYDFVGNYGWNALLLWLEISKANYPEEYKYMEYLLDRNLMITAMRRSIYQLFIDELYFRGKLSSIEFKEINFADIEQLGSLEQVRTEFLINDEISEIVWTFEHGRWRISDFQILASKYFGGNGGGNGGSSNGQKRAPGGPALPGGTRFGIGGAAGVAFATGTRLNNFDYYWPLFSWSIEGRMDIPLSDAFGIGTGLYLIRKGVGLEDEDFNGWYDVNESITYLQIPAILKAFINGGSFIVGGGLGINLALIKNATLTDSNYYDSIDSAMWFEDLSSFNISFNFLIASEIVLSADSSLGFETSIDYHLLEDFTWSYTDNSKYLTWRLSSYVTF